MNGSRLALILLAAALPLGACGSVNSFPDAAGGGDAVNADADLNPDASPRGTVKVTVIDPNSNLKTPIVGAQVVFLDPDGSVASRIATNGQGKAQGELLPGGSVVSVVVSQNQYSMQLIEAVKPGDDLELNYFQFHNDNTEIGTYSASWQAYNGAVSYYLYTPCGGASNSAATPLTATATFYQYCKPTTMDLIVVAYDQSSTPVAYLEKPNVSFSVNGSTALGNGWQSIKTLNATFTNLPAEVTGISMNHYVPDGSGFSAGANGTPTPGNSSLTLSAQVASAATAQIQNSFSSDQGGRQQLQAGIVGTTVNYNLDVGGSLLQWLGSFTFTPETGKLDIPVRGTSTVVPDGAYVALSYSRPAPVTALPGVIYNQYDWVIIRPNAGPLTLPVLPSEVGDVGPKAGDQVGGSFGAILEADSIDNYDAFKAGLGNLDKLFGQHQTTGTIRFSTSPQLR